MLTVGGLFSGIGGWELGLERAGMRVLWHCEADPYARAVLEHRWPGVPCYPDVRELRGADVEPVDVLCGGFPCQDISLAGKGAGIDGARSGLWSEFARLIGELRPRYVLVENVAALLGRGLDRVLGDLAALGYDAEWDCIPASAVGAPHRRDRIWLVAYPGSERRREDARRAYGDEAPDAGRRAPDEPGSPRAQRLHPGGRAASVADAIGERCSRRSYEPGRPEGPHAESERGGVGRRRWWESEPSVGRVAHGVPARMDRLRCLGNALVPQIAEWIGRRIIEWERVNP